MPLRFVMFLHPMVRGDFRRQPRVDGLTSIGWDSKMISPVQSVFHGPWTRTKAPQTQSSHGTLLRSISPPPKVALAHSTFCSAFAQ